MILIFVFESTGCLGQIKDMGIPFINNYSRELYGAHAQNWGIDQDWKNTLFFANNDGLLSFNGNEWDIYPLANQSIVRSVKCINNRIYVGGFNEFGYFIEDTKGIISYHSLSKHLPKKNENFDEIWRIFHINEGVYFQSYFNIFVYKDDRIEVIKPKSKFGYSYKVGNEILVVDRAYGLYKLKGKELLLIYSNKEFFTQNEITFILPHKHGGLLLGTTNNGVFILNKGELKVWGVDINKKLKQAQIYAGISLYENQLAIGTVQNGIYVINHLGKVILHLNRLRGLQHNTVLSLFSDNEENLWLGLDKGIDMLEVNSSITVFDYSHNIETSYTSIVYNGVLYIGTNQGLFAKNIDQIHNSDLLQEGFKKIEGTMGQIWSLKIIGGELICGHNTGTFVLKGMEATQISSQQGGWDYELVPWDTNYVIGGNYSGLTLFRKADTEIGWKEVGNISGFNESCKEMQFDKHKNLWITHGLKGVFRLKLENSLLSIKEFELIDYKKGLPAKPYSLTAINGKTFLVASDSIFQYNHYSKKFELNYEHSEKFANISGINRIIESNSGDLWYFTNKHLGVFRIQEDGSYLEITKPFNRISQFTLKGSFENIYNYKNQVFIGSDKGILHYEPNKSTNYDRKFYTYLKSVKIRTRKHDVESDGSSLLEQSIAIEQRSTDLNYKYNSISFKFYTPQYTSNVHFSYRLVGFEDEWSAWDKTSYKEYTNLKENNYVFEVKALNVFNNESKICRFSFTVKPPIYRSLAAYIFYIACLLSLIIGNIINSRIKVEKARRIEGIKNKKEFLTKEQAFKKEAQESEERIELLERENLKNEMRFKNMELANSTLGLIHKNKFLNVIKRELTIVSEKAHVQMVRSDLKKIVTRIDKDIKDDKNYKVFDKYFDGVHQDFIKRIKTQHANLTPKELRLCAYLRMNLSTKEIAPLMNVSIRGLEISRYRLRKKLEIDSKVNLVDYIMKV